MTQLEFVQQLNRQYLTKFHQKDVSRWLNTGNKTASGTIGFPKYETMAIIADFFGVDVGYLTGEIEESSFDLTKCCDYTGLDAEAVHAIQRWITVGSNLHNSSSDDISDETGAASNIATPETHDRLYSLRRETLNRMLASPQFPSMTAKMMTLLEMSQVWRNSPEKFNALMHSLASESDLPESLTFQLIVGAFYGMASESFSMLLRDAYPTPTDQQFAELNSAPR